MMAAGLLFSVYAAWGHSEGMSPFSPDRSSHLNTIQTASSPQPVQGPFSPETRFCEVDNKYHHTLQTGSWAHFPTITLSSLMTSTLLLPLLFLLLLGPPLLLLCLWILSLLFSFYFLLHLQATF